MERVKEDCPERERMPEEAGEYFEVHADYGGWVVSGAMAAHIERELSRFRVPEWIVFVSLHGSRVRVRASNIQWVAQASPDQRARDRAFEKALDDERDDPWADR